MISKAMILGVAAAVVATGTGFYVATVGNSSHCDGGCPIRSMLGMQQTSSTIPASTEEPGSCCNRVSKSALLTKVNTPDTPTLAACVGSSAYATQPQSAVCCEHE